MDRGEEGARPGALPSGTARLAAQSSEKERAIAQETPRERRRRRTREDLVAAALRVIEEVGVDGLTIERVSSESGISRGTVYAHFPDGRDELLRGAYASLGRDLVERTSSAATEALDWRASILAHGRALLDLASDERIGYFFNVSGPTLITDGAERGIGSGASARMIRDELLAARAEGLVGAGFDAAAAARLLVGALREAAVAVARDGADPGDALTAFGRLIDGLAA